MPIEADPKRRPRLSRPDARSAVLLRAAVHRVALGTGLATKRQLGRHRLGSGPLAAVVYTGIEDTVAGAVLRFTVGVSRDIPPVDREAWQRGTTAALVARLTARGLIVAPKSGSIVQGRHFGVPVQQLAVRQGMNRMARAPVAGNA